MTERSRVAPVSSRRKAVGTALQPRGSRRTGSASPSAQTLPLLRNLWAPLLSPTPTWPFSILCPSPTLHPELIPSEGPSDRALSRGSLTWLVSRVYGPRLLRKHPSLPHSPRSRPLWAAVFTMVPTLSFLHFLLHTCWCHMRANLSSSFVGDYSACGFGACLLHSTVCFYVEIQRD